MHQMLNNAGSPTNYDQTGFRLTAGSGFGLNNPGFSVGSGFGYQIHQNHKRVSEISIPSQVDSPPRSCKCT